MRKYFGLLGTVGMLFVLAANAQAPPILITSLPTLKSGQLKGAHFGAGRGKIYVTGRFDMTKLCSSDPEAARSQWMQFYDCKPVGQKEVALPDSVVKTWTDSGITLEWPPAAKDGKMTQAAFIKTLRYAQQGYIADEFPLDSAEYIVELPDGARSNAK